MTAIIDRPAASSPDVPDPPARRHWIAVHRDNLAFVTLLVATAIFYLANLSANGWANSFYAAASQAGSKSWKAFLFGSSDMANSITVDKPPASLWLPAISMRIFGVNSWALLVPEVLLGVASVALLYVMVKRYFGANAGLLAGATLALTPVAALMFRFNNPEALLILLTIAAVWALLRAMEDGRTRWLVLSGVFIGFAFLTKQMAAFLVVPALGVGYLGFGAGRSWLSRFTQLLAGLVAIVVSAGWWLLVVSLWPTDSRPYVGGSQHNSFLELTFGYNGFGRLTGDETGSVVGGGGRNSRMAEFAGQFPGGFGGGRGGGMWGQTGWLRMFEPAQGGQIAWLIPAALILGVLGIVLRGKARRSDIIRGFFVVNLLWLLVTMAVFSFMSGIFHQYYTVALAAPIAALVGAGAFLAWRERRTRYAAIVLSAAIIAAGAMAFVLLGRSSDFLPWLRWVVLPVAVIAALALHVPRRSIAVAAALAAIVAALAGPTAYAVDTVSTATEGSIVSAGPAVNGGGFGPGMRPRGTMNSPAMRQLMQRFQQQFGQNPGGRQGAQQFPQQGRGTGMARGRGNGQGFGGFLEGRKPSDAEVALLTTDADKYTWVAAAIGSNSASGVQLATGHSVMPVGGFNGTDPSPTLDEFKQLVAAHKIHYFIGGGMMGGRQNGGSSSSSEISEWVQANFKEVTVDGTTLYDLTAPTT